MLSIRNLSFRYKIPLRSTVLVLITAVPLTLSILFHEYHDMKNELVHETAEISHLLTQSLITPMLHDDVWHTYQTIESPFPKGTETDTSIKMAMVLDSRQQIYVSSDPARYPTLSNPAHINSGMKKLQSAVASYHGTEPKVIDIPDSKDIFVITPIVSEGTSLGTLVLVYSEAAFLQHFYHLVDRSAFITLLLLAVLLPASWYWAHRMATPLVQLAKCMGKIGPRIPPDLEECALYMSKDEIGQVGMAFKHMFYELKNKENLEKQIAVSERLAAVGRLSAGIAHEINNPLGGMLNAINTFKRHGNNDPITAKTVSLLERGLLHIRDTVAALLVETRVDSNNPLTRQDIEDTRTLVLGKVNKKMAEFRWQNDMVDSVPLPSTLVRQVTINLLLNAIQSVNEYGHIDGHIYLDNESLFIVVKNDGCHIPSDRMEHLFEPFSSESDADHSLGLWVTYQAVQRMAGYITVESGPGETCFTVVLPLLRTI